MKKFSALFVGVSTSVVSAAGISQAVGSQPNIVLILADDLGYHDVGFQGDPLYAKISPNIDTLARDGARFTQSYVSCSVCAPSRAGLMTGIHQQRFGFENNDAEKWDPKKPDWFGVDTSQQTVADRLKGLGYYTGVVGKWHLGFGEQYYPTKRGFDYFYGFRGGSRSFFPSPDYEKSGPPDQYKLLEKNGAPQPESRIKHVTESLGDAALEFLKEAQEESKPFFLYLAFNAPHAPLQPDSDSLAVVSRIFPQVEMKRKNYLGLVVGMDRQVGRVLTYLKESGLEKNTLVVFLSDNGGSAKNASNNDPLRGNKWSPFEGGYRVPMALRWPGVVAPGSVIATPVISLDLLPTFIEAAGGKQPSGLDGVALNSLLSGKSDLEPRLLMWRESNGEGWTTTILRQPWKLILRKDSKFKKLENTDPWLFNIADDPKETKNLAGDYPETVKELSKLVNGWSATLEEPRW